MNSFQVRFGRWPASTAGLLAALLLTASSVRAADGASPPAGKPAADDTAAATPTADRGAAPSGEPSGEARALPWQEGPRLIDLGNDIEVDLLAGYSFLGSPDASALMESMGNLHNENLLGLVIGEGEENPWFVSLRYEASGYVRDDEKVDGEELLSSMRESLPALNEERTSRGFSALKLDGWDEAPRYDARAHHLIWCLRVSDDGGASSNYNTRVLGRRGYASINLVTDPSRVEADKKHAAAVLENTRFRAGARYGDFNEETDKVAEYGLAGLILGGAGFGAMKLAKVGLFAKLGKVLIPVLLAGKKFIVVGLALGAGLLSKVFGRKGDASKEG